MGEQTAGDPARAARAAAIGEFAATLRQLRRSVGDPSFREMAGRSRAISHTTLHEAAQGNRLPSWATTVEFIRACGADPAEYRARWERADRALRTEPVPVDADERTLAVTVPPEPAPDDEAATPGRGRRVAMIGAAGAAVVAACVVVAVVASSGDDQPEHSPSTAASHAPTLSAADCPIHQTNPPPAPPEHAGDASEFVADLTLPDCSHVQRDHTVTKVWRLKNAGTVSWNGYYLHRLGSPQSRDQCQTVSDVPLRATAPGAIVDVRVQVLTPRVPTFCFVRFKMMDAAGRVVFPGSRPVNFQLVVD